jgi:hypothetical protein
MHREIITVYAENYKEHLNTLSQNVKFFNPLKYSGNCTYQH